MTSRRQFLKSASLSGMAAAFAPHLLRNGGGQPFFRTIGDPGHRPMGSAPILQDPELHELAQRAIDAAHSAGAQYADVRFTLTQHRSLGTATGSEQFAVGVRALANGAWGFVGGPSWERDDVTQLGTRAAQQAAENLWNPASRVELNAPPAVATGSWSTPIQRDFFDVPAEEAQDLIGSILQYLYTRAPDLPAGYGIGCQRQERTVVTSDGAFNTQLLHTAFDWGEFVIDGRSPEWLSPTGAGYEAIQRLADLNEIDRLVDEALRKQKSQAIDIGRFDVVFDGYAMAALLGRTLGEPSEIDRVRGFEANAGGTSYLATAAEPTLPLGTKRLGPSFLTVRGNRSMPAGAATVKWDDEGVTPDEFDLIHQGIVTDYSTTRQHVAVLKNYYQSNGRPLQSHGCSSGATALDFPLVATPNLTMTPSKPTASFENLVSSVTDGYAVMGGDWNMDQQGLTGQWADKRSMVYRIKQGKLTTPVKGIGLMVRSPDLWKNLVAIGDATTQKTRGFSAQKGQPDMRYQYSASAPAAKITNLSVADLARKFNA